MSEGSIRGYISQLAKTPLKRKSKIPMLLATNVVSTSDNDDGEEMSFNDDEMTYDAAEYLQLLNKTVPSSIPVIGYNIFHGMRDITIIKESQFLKLIHYRL